MFVVKTNSEHIFFIKTANLSFSIMQQMHFI